MGQSNRFLAAVVVLALSAVIAFAQAETSAISGRVADPHGLAVSDADVTATNVDTNISYTRQTNSSGFYNIAGLPPGTYRVTVQKDGFARVVKPGVILHVQDEAGINFSLQVGSVTESVTVEGGAPLVQTDSAAVRTVVDRQFVENIPLNGRSFQSLITLSPGVILVPSGFNTDNGGGQFTVNGQRATANNFTVDGVSANFGPTGPAAGGPSTTGNLPGMTTFGTTQALVSVDALQEFTIQTSTYAAEFGRQPGGQISIVTRSGTNQFHGTAFDYLRNTDFDANDWFAGRAGLPRAPEHQNDFGGVFGGPVVIPHFYNGRSRTFFFFSYEGLRLLLPTFTLTNVPTSTLRQTAAAGLQPILNAFPLPNGTDLGNGTADFTSAYSNPSNLNATSLRIDHTVSKKLTLFARYNKAPSFSAVRQGSNLSQIITSRLAAQTITLGVTTLLTTKTSNDFRANYSGDGAYTLTSSDTFGGAIPPPRSALIPSQFDGPGAKGSSDFNFVGRTATSPLSIAVAGPTLGSERQFNYVDNFSYTVGSHQFKFGVDYRRLTPTLEGNTYLIDGTFRTEAQVLAGTTNNGVVNASVGTHPLIENFSLYADDTWKASRRLTLNLGVRWDVNPSPTDLSGHNPAVVNQITNLATMQLAPFGTPQWKTTYNNFAPRMGAAYQLVQTRGRETVVRGGFGVFYDAGNDQGAANFNTAFPYASSRILSSFNYPLVAAQVAPLPFPILTVPLATPYPFVTLYDPNLKLPYTLQWNVALEQSLGKDQAFTVTYVGAAGRRLLQLNELLLGPGFGTPIINPNFTLALLTTNNATSDYDALQAQFQRRLSHGLQALVSYSWSHALDSDSSAGTGAFPQRGNAVFDVRQVFASALTYDIPRVGSNSVVHAVLGWWSVDSTFHAQSALPVDLVGTQLVDAATGGIQDVRPNFVPGVPVYVSCACPGGREINRAAFAIAPGPVNGDVGRNQVRGLGAWQQDFALRREFPLHERLKLQFRVEAFNIFNHPNFGTVQNRLGAANFGQATNMLNRQLGNLSQLYQIGGPRSLQFAMKLLF